jgi:hypothetical protein
MNEQNQQTENQTAAFLRLWTDSFAKLGQAAFSFSPDAVPPELLRQVRTGMFQALAQSWDEFLHSPQFMEGMKQMMDNAVALRKLSTEFLTKARHELGGVAQEDVDGLVVAVHHLETQVLGRVDGLTNQIAEMNRRLESIEKSLAASTSAFQETAERPARGRHSPKNTQSRTAPESNPLSP